MQLNSEQLARALRAGQVGVMPTDTIYGLCCMASNQVAVERLYALKSREQKPGTVIAASVEQLVNLGLKARYLKPVEQYWPNSISIIIPSEPNLRYLDMGKGSLALRVPKDESLRQLLERTGPLLTTSVNHPGEPPASNLAEAKSYFGQRVDFYVDGGDLSGRPASTIIRIVDDAVEVLREGAVKINQDSGGVE